MLAHPRPHCSKDTDRQQFFGRDKEILRTNFGRCNTLVSPEVPRESSELIIFPVPSSLGVPCERIADRRLPDAWMRSDGS